MIFSSASTRWRTDAGSVPRPGNGVLLSVNPRAPGRAAGAATSAYAGAKRLVAKPCTRSETSDQRIGAVRAINSCCSSIRCAAWASRPLRWAVDRRRPRAVQQFVGFRVANRDFAAAERAHEPGRRGRRRDLVDQAKSAASPGSTASTVMPSAPQSLASRLSRILAPGAFGQCDPHGRLFQIAEHAPRRRRELRPALARSGSPSMRRGRRLQVRRGRAREASPGARRPGTFNASIRACRSIAWLSRRRSSRSAARPVCPSRNKPEQPGRRVEAKRVFRHFARRARREGPQKSRRARGRSSPCRKAVTAARAGLSAQRPLPRARPIPRRDRSTVRSSFSAFGLLSFAIRNGPGALTLADDRELRLREQLKQMGAGSLQADFDARGRSSGRSRRSRRACPSADCCSATRSAA